MNVFHKILLTVTLMLTATVASAHPGHIGGGLMGELIHSVGGHYNFVALLAISTTLIITGAVLALRARRK